MSHRASSGWLREVVMAAKRRQSLHWLAATVLAIFLAAPCATAADGSRAPNVIFILADDLGYGDLGCYGQKQIQTPQLDKMAAEGMRFTQCYSGSTVCGPSRGCLMTGKHTGHAIVRGNKEPTLPADAVTVAEVMKDAGYRSALIGKWGMSRGPDAVFDRKGFDYFYGFMNHVHAHNHYPDYLWRNKEKVPLAGNVVDKGVATNRAQYAHDLFTKEALAWLDQERDKPFFLYLAYTIPHANNEAGKNGMEVPDDEPYAKKDWPQAQKNHAAMITRLDRDVGRLFDRLKELKIDDNTIVFFTSDNGPHKEGGADPAFFQSAGPLRGFKRDLTEGGIRVPMIVRWPGRVKAGTVSDHVWAFWDFLPTAAALAGTKTPEGLDGISVLPTLRGDKGQKTHDFLYWEFHERGFDQAVRMGDWKYIRRPYTKDRTPELYNLKEDLGESKNVAEKHPDVVAKLEAYLKDARTESRDYPLPPKTK